MRKIKICFLFIFAYTTSFAQVGRVQATDVDNRGAQSFYGLLYSKNSWANLSDFVDSSSGASVSGSKIVFTGGSASNYNKKLGLNIPSALEHFKITAKIRVGTISGTSIAFGIGAASINPWTDINWLGRTDYVTSGTNGAVKMEYGALNSFQRLITSPSLVSAASNDYVIMTLERNVNQYTITLRNATTNAAEVDTTYTSQLVYDPGGNFIIPNNTCLYSIYNFGGSFTLDSLAVTSTEILRPNLLILGDSRIVGYGAGGYNQRMPYFLGQKFGSVVVSAGGGDRTVDVLNRLAEVIALKPKQVLVAALGLNDLAQGTSVGTIQTNYASIITQLQAAGIKVSHAINFYSSAVNEGTLNAWIVSTYGTSVIDTYSPTATPGCLQPDGLHLTAIGYKRAADAILNSFVLTAPTNSILDYVIQSGGGGSSGINNSTSLQSSANFNISGSGQLGSMLLSPTGSYSVAKIYNGSTSAGDMTAYLYPSTLTNVSNSWYIIPRGSGNGSNQSNLGLFATDYVAGQINFSGTFFQMHPASMDIYTLAGGSSPLVPLRLFTGSNTQIVLNTNGTNAITGNTSITGIDSVYGNLVTTGNFTVAGTAAIGSTLSVNGLATLTSGLSLPAGGSGNTLKLYNSNTISGYAVGTFYPTTGANTATNLYLIPKANGQTGNMSQIVWWGSDFIAGQTNYEYGSVTYTGTNFEINTTKGGSSTIKPIIVYTGANTNQLKWNTNGSLLFGKYGIGTFTGTVAKYLAVDASGNVIEDAGTGGYTLPTASTSVLGGVKVDGTSITIASGVISAGAAEGGATIGSTSSWGTNVTSVTPTGVDRDFKLVVVTSGNVNGTICFVAFSSFTTTPICTVSPGNSGTAQPVFNGGGSYVAFGASTNTSATLAANITGAGTYTFNCHCGK